MTEFAQERVGATVYPPLKEAMQRAADLGAQVGARPPTSTQYTELLTAVEDQGRACAEGGVRIDWLA